MSAIRAYQILKRLRVEELEEALEDHFGERPEDFPIPARLAERLVMNARPMQRYLEFQRGFAHGRQREFWQEPHDVALDRLVHGEVSDARQEHAQESTGFQTWHVLRLLDGDTVKDTLEGSRYIGKPEFEALRQAGIVERSEGPGGNREHDYRFGEKFLAEFEEYLGQYFEEVSLATRDERLLDRCPNVLSYAQKAYVPLPER
jgi:hypothetical protein